MSNNPDKKVNDSSVSDLQSNAYGRLNSHRFLSSGILLFIDQLLIAAGGWIYWIMMSKVATPTEIGSATTLYSIILLVATICQLGLEFPLLRDSGRRDPRLLGTILIIETSVIAVAAFVTVFYIQYESVFSVSSEVTAISIGILLVSGFAFVSRFALLGISDVRRVMIIDFMGTVIKFATGYILLSTGFGTAGILLSFLLQNIALSAIMTFLAIRETGLKYGGSEYLRKVVTNGLSNTPAKIGRIFIVSLSMILLAYQGISAADSGVFYLTLMISIVAGSFAASIAFMVMPASSSSNQDLSTAGTRLGLSFTSPIIVALLASPSWILSLLGKDYAVGEYALVILSIAILPYAIVSNAISKFNNLQKLRKLVIIGLSQLISFLPLFYLLVPQYSITGAAFSILISSTISAVPSIIWSADGKFIRYVIVSVTSIIAGYGVSLLINTTLAIPVVSVTLSTSAAMTVIVLLKNTSLKEIIGIVRVASRS